MNLEELKQQIKDKHLNDRLYHEYFEHIFRGLYPKGTRIFVLPHPASDYARDYVEEGAEKLTRIATCHYLLSKEFLEKHKYDPDFTKIWLDDVRFLAEYTKEVLGKERCDVEKLSIYGPTIYLNKHKNLNCLGYYIELLVEADVRAGVPVFSCNGLMEK